MYVDGFVLVVPKKNVPAYKKLATVARKVWMEHGALSYVEAMGDDLKTGFGVPFTKLTGAKPSETVFFSFITYKSKAHRNQVNKKVMADKRIDCGGQKMPFDMKRFSHGGFRGLVVA